MTMHSNCETCPAHAEMARLGEAVGGFDRVVALAGNPEHRQVHAIQRADRPASAHRQLAGQDGHARRGRISSSTSVRYKLVDLPGTYSLLSASQDEEVARDFLLFGQPRRHGRRRRCHARSSAI